MTGQWAATVGKGTEAARDGSAEATTTRLIALLRITAGRAANRNALIRTGSRNSEPPSPIRPPSAPMRAPLPMPQGRCGAAKRQPLHRTSTSPFVTPLR